MCKFWHAFILVLAFSKNEASYGPIVSLSNIKKLIGKKAIFIILSEEDIEASEYLVKMFELTFKFLGIQLINTFPVKAGMKGEVKKQPNILEKALTIGRSVAKSYVQ